MATAAIGVLTSSHGSPLQLLSRFDHLNRLARSLPRRIAMALLGDAAHLREEVDDVKVMLAAKRAAWPSPSAHAAGYRSRRCRLAAHGVAGSLLAEQCGAAPRQVSSDRHMKRPAEGGGEVEGWSSCCGRPPPRAQGCGELAGETSVGSGKRVRRGSF